jgi:hypothetical protein
MSVLHIHWLQIEKANLYRLAIEDLHGNPVVTSILLSGASSYQAPSWLPEKAENTVLRWRVSTFDEAGKQINQTTWRESSVW